jgi:hypothetical protein
MLTTMFGNLKRNHREVIMKKTSVLHVLIKVEMLALVCLFSHTNVFAKQSLQQYSGHILDFNDYFIDSTMRVDFFMTGDANEQKIALDNIYRQGRWAGNPRKTIDDLNLGGYYVKVYDIASNRLIFSRGFSCVFFEYRTTRPAMNGEKRTFQESMLMPYPRRPVLFVLESRDKLNILHPIFILKIDPNDDSIIPLESNPEDKVFDILINGDCHDKVDFVFLAEGYTSEEAEKFKDVAERFTNYLFDMEPYKSHKSQFNVRAVMRPSAESGVDQPTRGIECNTVMDASSNALGTARYMLINNNKAMQDVAAAVPCDAILIAANTSIYANGGIYNRYCIFAADNNRSPSICPHEFGHAFGGLADEYFSSDVAYSDFFPPGVEPLEPNITALLNPARPKWAHLIKSGTPIPTEPDKDDPEKIGVFEGAGYAAKGLYRPMNSCIMRSGRQFCKVCQEAIVRVIDHFSDAE